ncbi:11922_t:CDS:2, partial [Entrophospora sp. SA101]
MPRYLRADATPLSPEAICEIMNAKYTKNVLSVLVKKYKISNTRIYKIWRGQEYYAGLTFKVDQNQNIDWDKEIENATPLSPEDIEEIKNAPSNIPNAGRVMCKKYRIGMTRYRDIINNRIPREPTEEWLHIVELVKNSSAPTILPENPNRTDENTLHLESSVAPINLPVPVV